MKVLCAILAFLWAPALSLANTNEIQITAGPGYTSLPDLADGLDGIGGGLEVTYGITPFWSAAMGGFVGYHFEQVVVDVTAQTPEVFEATTVVTAWLGPKFNLDVFVVVPYIGLSPELVVTQGELMEGQEEWDFGLRWTIGFDYRPLRHWSIGFEANYHSFLLAPLDYPVYISTMFRLSYHHGFDEL